MEEKIKSGIRNKSIYNIVVIGAGGWGTALAILLHNNGHKVHIWTHEDNVIEEINNDSTNQTYLAGIELPSGLNATRDVNLINEADLIVNAVPSQYIYDLYTRFNLDISNKLVVNGSKGIEQKSLLRVSEIFINKLSLPEENFCVITGPSHAEEVARNTPTTVVAGAYDFELARLVQSLFSNSTFRVYSSDDVSGCEIGGALKNVIAIAAGIIDGLNFGDNTKAALITRGLAEISRLGITIGANPLTFSGLSGLGDLFVTCNSRHSRNRSVGEKIGKGANACDIISSTKMVAEGVSTAESAYQLGKNHGVELPITQEVYQILFHSKDPRQAIIDLMNRRTKREWWW